MTLTLVLGKGLTKDSNLIRELPSMNSIILSDDEEEVLAASYSRVEPMVK